VIVTELKITTENSTNEIGHFIDSITKDALTNVTNQIFEISSQPTTTTTIATITTTVETSTATTEETTTTTEETTTTTEETTTTTEETTNTTTEETTTTTTAEKTTTTTAETTTTTVETTSMNSVEINTSDAETTTTSSVENTTTSVETTTTTVETTTTENIIEYKLSIPLVQDLIKNDFKNQIIDGMYNSLGRVSDLSEKAKSINLDDLVKTVVSKLESLFESKFQKLGEQINRINKKIQQFKKVSKENDDGKLF
jgi:hypothetical protein